MTTVFVGGIGIYSLAGGLTGSPAQITRVAPITVVMAGHADATHNWFVLPDNAEIGDVIEVYQDLSLLALYDNIGVRASSGENFGDTNSGTIVTQVDVVRGGFFRKLTSTTWGMQGPL